MRYAYRDFWDARGRTCFWVAEHAGYGPGSLLAWLAARIGLRPDVVSLLSLLVVAAGMALIATKTFSSPAGGIIIFLSLFGAYWLDCADGVLARVTGQASSFGAVLDKVVDFVGAMLVVAILGLSAMGQTSPLVPVEWQAVIFVFSLLPKSAFSVLSWLKDSYLHAQDHARHIQITTCVHKFKRAVGNLLDDVPWRLGLSSSWAVGWFWEFTLVFNLLLGAVLVGYSIASKRELDANDRRRATVAAGHRSE
ncbi:MAG: CDP-alcohol phosphatidyltransferase family protein [Verrucomicrobiales bacterium]